MSKNVDWPLNVNFASKKAAKLSFSFNIKFTRQIKYQPVNSILNWSDILGQTKKYCFLSMFYHVSMYTGAN